jgi:hypothetical protein
MVRSYFALLYIAIDTPIAVKNAKTIIIRGIFLESLKLKIFEIDII